MRILSPVLNADEASAVIDAGASELYCGVLSGRWKEKYTNVASPNRREWYVANMQGYDQLAAVVDVAHAKNAKVYLTMNALYTGGQYDEVQEIIKQAGAVGADAVIVADIGLLLSLREMGWKGEIHISTGGTTFNSETVAFYRDLGATRVIIPRQNRISEIGEIARSNPDMQIECFIMNCGCKNIDGFCTFHHGVRDLQTPFWWKLVKQLRGDYYLLALLRKLPISIREKVSRAKAFRSDSACFLPYEIDIEAEEAAPGQVAALRQNLRNNFSLFSGVDTCGACPLWVMKAAGVYSLKIVGRANPLTKKVNDVKFLHTCIQQLDQSPTREDFETFAKAEFRRVFGCDCRNWCYFPHEDLALDAAQL